MLYYLCIMQFFNNLINYVPLREYFYKYNDNLFIRYSIFELFDIVFLIFLNGIWKDRYFTAPLTRWIALGAWLLGKKYEQFVRWCATCHSIGKVWIVTLDEFFATVFISSVPWQAKERRLRIHEPASIARPGSTVNRRDLGDERHIGQCIAQTALQPVCTGCARFTGVPAATGCMMHCP